MTNPNTPTDGPRMTALGKTVVFLFVLAMIAGGAWLFMQRNQPASNNTTVAPNPTGNPTITPVAIPSADSVTIGIAYGTEKKGWLEQAATDFAATPAGKNITVNLIPMGSLEGAQAVVKGDKRINVWTPASSMYKDTFVNDWQSKNTGDPIVKEADLALTPMVFIVWEERYQSFIAKYKEMNYGTINQALNEPGGWGAISGKPEWGVFKFGHTHPNESNSGLAALVLMGYTFNDKSKGLEVADIVKPEFQKSMGDVERGTSWHSNSTGNMVKEMVLKGPSVYDAVLAYESTAVDFLKNAEGRWGKLRVVYPKYNMWNESPYYVLNVPWSTDAQKAAAGKFLDFLQTVDVQKQAVIHGFRPTNVAVGTNGPDSPFILFKDAGLSDNIGTICETPKGEVINNLLLTWQRTAGSP